MFGSLGGAEILMILVLALLLFGPRKLPQIGRTIGRAMGEFRRATHDLRSSLEQEVATEDLRQTRDELQQVGDEVAKTVREANPMTLARGTCPETGEDPTLHPARTPEPANLTEPSDAERPTDNDDGTDGKL